MPPVSVSLAWVWDFAGPPKSQMGWATQGLEGIAIASRKRLRRRSTRHIVHEVRGGASSLTKTMTAPGLVRRSGLRGAGETAKAPALDARLLCAPPCTERWANNRAGRPSSATHIDAGAQACASSGRRASALQTSPGTANGGSGSRSLPAAVPHSLRFTNGAAMTLPRDVRNGERTRGARYAPYPAGPRRRRGPRP
jgi:hypothetical protein